jgi:hypothetical protein
MSLIHGSCILASASNHSMDSVVFQGYQDNILHGGFTAHIAQCPDLQGW